ncbi:MAG: hypothetical protein ACLTSX_11645 [Collinsella sp.]
MRIIRMPADCEDMSRRAAKPSSAAQVVMDPRLRSPAWPPVPRQWDLSGPHQRPTRPATADFYRRSARYRLDEYTRGLSRDDPQELPLLHEGRTCSITSTSTRPTPMCRMAPTPMPRPPAQYDRIVEAVTRICSFSAISSSSHILQ